MAKHITSISANQAEHWGKSNRHQAPSLNDEILMRNHANRVRREAPARRREAEQSDAALWDRGLINRARDAERRVHPGHEQSPARRARTEAARDQLIEAARTYNEAVEDHQRRWWETNGATYGYSVDAAMPHWHEAWETEGQAAEDAAAPSFTAYYQAVVDDLRRTAQNAGPLGAPDALNTQAWFTASSSTGDEVIDDQLRGVLTQAQETVLSEAPEVREAAIDVADRFDELEEANVALLGALQRRDIHFRQPNAAHGLLAREYWPQLIADANRRVADAEGAVLEAIDRELTLRLADGIRGSGGHTWQEAFHGMDQYELDRAELQYRNAVYGDVDLVGITDEGVDAAVGDMVSSHPEILTNPVAEGFVVYQSDAFRAQPQLRTILNNPNFYAEDLWRGARDLISEQPVSFAYIAALNADHPISGPNGSAEEILAEASPILFAELKYLGGSLPETEFAGRMSEGAVVEAAMDRLQDLSDPASENFDQERAARVSTLREATGDLRASWVSEAVGDTLSSQSPLAGVEQRAESEPEFIGDGVERADALESATAAERAMALIEANMRDSFSPAQVQQVWGAAERPLLDYLDRQASYLEQRYEYPDDQAVAVGNWLVGLSLYAPGEAADVLLTETMNRFDQSLASYPGGGPFLEGIQMATEAAPHRADQVARWTSGVGEDGSVISEDALVTLTYDGSGEVLAEAVISHYREDYPDRSAAIDDLQTILDESLAARDEAQLSEVNAEIHENFMADRDDSLQTMFDSIVGPNGENADLFTQEHDLSGLSEQERRDLIEEAVAAITNTEISDAEIQQIDDWIVEVGGEDATISFVVTVYASDRDGVTPLPLILVHDVGTTDRDDTTIRDYGRQRQPENYIIDASVAAAAVRGQNVQWKYRGGLGAYVDQNQLDGGGRLYTSQSDDLLLDVNEHNHVQGINFEGIKASETTGWERTRRIGDGLAAVAGAGAIIISGGTLAPLAPVLLAGATAWGLGRTIETAAEMSAHGQSLNPFRPGAEGSWFGVLDPDATSLWVGGLASAYGMQAIRPGALTSSMLGRTRFFNGLGLSDASANMRAATQVLGETSEVVSRAPLLSYQMALSTVSPHVQMGARVFGGASDIIDGVTLAQQLTHADFSDWTSIDSPVWDLATFGVGLAAGAAGRAAGRNPADSAPIHHFLGDQILMSEPALASIADGADIYWSHVDSAGRTSWFQANREQGFVPIEGSLDTIRFDDGALLWKTREDGDGTIAFDDVRRHRRWRDPAQGTGEVGNPSLILPGSQNVHNGDPLVLPPSVRDPAAGDGEATSRAERPLNTSSGSIMIAASSTSLAAYAAQSIEAGSTTDEPRRNQQFGGRSAQPDFGAPARLIITDAAGREPSRFADPISGEVTIAEIAHIRLTAANLRHQIAEAGAGGTEDAPIHIRVLPDGQFEAAYREHGGLLASETVNGFVDPSRPVGGMPIVILRAGKVEAAAHELSHAFARPEFTSLASRMHFGDQAAHLEEGAAEYLAFLANGPKSYTETPGGFARLMNDLAQDNDPVLGELHFLDATIAVEHIADSMGRDAFLRARHGRDQDAVQLFESTAQSLFGGALQDAPEASHILHALHAPSGPGSEGNVRLSNIQDRLFGPSRDDELRQGINDARAANENGCFLIPESVKTHLVDDLVAIWREALFDTYTAPASTQAVETDIDLIRTLARYFQDNQVVMNEPDPDPASTNQTNYRLYHTNAELRQRRFTQEPEIRRFLDDFLSGAHFAVPSHAEVPGIVSDLYGLFGEPPLRDHTKRVLGHSHYAYTWLGIKFGDGLGYPSKVKADQALDPAPIANGVLVGTGPKGEPFVQLESWPAVKGAGLLGRHRRGYKVHQETHWNISTYGASPFSEKQGKTIILQPTPKWDAALDNRARQIADEIGADVKDGQDLLGDFNERVREAIATSAADDRDQAFGFYLDQTARKNALTAVRTVAHDDKATKAIFKKKGADLAAGLANDAATTDASRPARAEFDRLGTWRLRRKRQEIAEMAGPQAGAELAGAVRQSMEAEANALDLSDMLDTEVNTIAGELLEHILPETLLNAAREAGKRKIHEEVEAFVAAHPDAAPHEIAEAGMSAVNNLDLRAETLSQMALWSQTTAGLPEEVGTSARMAGEFAVLSFAEKAVSGKIDETAGREAREGAPKALTTAMEPRLKQIADQIVEPIQQRAALSLPERLAADAVAESKMRFRLWKARFDARRQVRAELRPQLETLAMQISGQAVNAAFTWVVEQARQAGRSSADDRSNQAIGRDFAREARSHAAIFVRAAAMDAETNMAAGPSTLSDEQRYALSAAEHIALQAVKANLTSGWLRHLRTIGTLAAGNHRLLSRLFQPLVRNHITRKVQGRGVSRLHIDLPLRLKGATIGSRNVERLTRKTTLKASRWLARQPDIQQLARKTMEGSVLRQVAPYVQHTIMSPQTVGFESDSAITARQRARDGSILQTAQTEAASSVQAQIRPRMAEAVLERNFFPDSDGKARLSPTERVLDWAMEPLFHTVSYTQDSYAELYETIPEHRRKRMPEPGQFRGDNATLMLAEIPAGLEDIVADIHAHMMGYDRRRDRFLQPGQHFEALLGTSGGTSRILFGSIPQYCGGDAHYSTATPSKASMKKAYRLDGRVVNDWLRLFKHDPEKAAKADLSITGINFADTKWWRPHTWSHQAFRDPVGYTRRMMLRYPGRFVAIGEITGIKEMVTRQLGPWAWNAGSEKFQALLAHANETGQIVLLHNDWGEHGTSMAGRPSPAMQSYEHFNLLKYVFSQPQYSNLQIVFAHTGIGRLVRPDDTVSSKEHTIREWDWQTGRVVAERKVQVDNAPEHIHRIYELFEAVPNARVDISWNDVTQAYNDLMQANPQAADSIVQLFIDHQDRILFGSDTVKPVNPGQYNQCLETGAPLIAMITRRNRDAAYKILRGNYEDAMHIAERRVDRWTETRLRARRSRAHQREMPIRARGAERKIHIMNEQRRVLDEHRANMRAESRRKFNAWADALPDDWSVQVHNNGNPGVFPSIYEQLPHSIPRTEGGRIGADTSGGGNNDERWRKTATAGTAVAGGAGLACATDFGVGHSGDLFQPTAGVGSNHVSGSGFADIGNAIAFLGRGGVILGRTLYTEKLRLAWEAIFEQGVVTREGLDRYVSRLRNSAPYLGITPLQFAQVAAVTEQFWANYTFLRDKPIDPASGWTENQKFLALHATVGEYMITVSREANLQESSLNALDARRRSGRSFRGLTLATYALNNAVSWKWLEAGGFDLQVFHDVFNDPSLIHTHSAAETSFRLLFALGNAALTTREGVSLIGGFFNITGTETNKFQRAMQRWGMTALTAGGGAWTAADALVFINGVKTGDPEAIELASTLLKAAFTYGAGWSAHHEFNRARLRPMSKPLSLAKPAILLGGALVALMIIAIAKRG